MSLWNRLCAFLRVQRHEPDSPEGKKARQVRIQRELSRAYRTGDPKKYEPLERELEKSL